MSDFSESGFSSQVAKGVTLITTRSSTCEGVCSMIVRMEGSLLLGMQDSRSDGGIISVSAVELYCYKPPE